MNAAIDIKIERAMPPVMPWALIAAACLASFAASCSGATTRAPLLLEIARDLDVSMPLVANLVSLTSVAWGAASAMGGWLSDRIGRRIVLIVAPLLLGITMALQARAGTFGEVAALATVGAASPPAAPSWVCCSRRSPRTSRIASADGRWAG